MKNKYQQIIEKLNKMEKNSSNYLAVIIIKNIIYV